MNSKPTNLPLLGDKESSYQMSHGDLRSKDAGHFSWSTGMLLGSEQRYQVIGHFGDGTFGRALKCTDIITKKNFAVKMIRSVKRYTESAKVEADILRELKLNGGCNHNIVDLVSQFTHES
jgi:dual-specificity kinase